MLTAQSQRAWLNMERHQQYGADLPPIRRGEWKGFTPHEKFIVEQYLRAWYPLSVRDRPNARP